MHLSNQNMGVFSFWYYVKKELDFQIEIRAICALSLSLPLPSSLLLPLRLYHKFQLLLEFVGHNNVAATISQSSIEWYLLIPFCVTRICIFSSLNDLLLLNIELCQRFIVFKIYSVQLINS